MTARLLTSFAVVLTAVSAGRAQSVDLTEAPLANRCFRIELTLALKGKITVQQQGETVSFPQEADARHVYAERVLQASGALAVEPTMDVDNVARAVVYMASLPLDANVLFLTVMATKMPFVGRG